MKLRFLAIVALAAACAPSEEALLEACIESLAMDSTDETFATYAQFDGEAFWLFRPESPTDENYVPGWVAPSWSGYVRERRACDGTVLSEPERIGTEGMHVPWYGQVSHGDRALGYWPEKPENEWRIGEAYVQLMDRDGSRSDPPVKLASDDARFASDVAAIADDDGFVVAWHAYDEDVQSIEVARLDPQDGTLRPLFGAQPLGDPAERWELFNVILANEGDAGARVFWAEANNETGETRLLHRSASGGTTEQLPLPPYVRWNVARQADKTWVGIDDYGAFTLMDLTGATLAVPSPFGEESEYVAWLVTVGERWGVVFVHQWEPRTSLLMLDDDGETVEQIDLPDQVFALDVIDDTNLMISGWSPAEEPDSPDIWWTRAMTLGGAQ